MPSHDRPNIVLVLSDQHHRSVLGCYGNPLVATPHIDKLAERGRLFTNAFCCSPICSPSRAALFTGILPHRFGEVRNDLALPDGIATLASRLSSQDYRLGYAGKWHVDRDSLPSDHGFEGKDFPGYGYPYPVSGNPDDRTSAGDSNHYYRYLEDHGYDFPRMVDIARTWSPERATSLYALQARLDCPVEASLPCFVGKETEALVRTFAGEQKADGRPFFVWSNFWGPHNPCLVPEPYFSMYDPADIPPPDGFYDDLNDKPDTHKLLSLYWGVYGAPWSFWQKHLAAYYGYCTLIDHQVGRIYAAVEAADQLDRTLFIFSADHGDMLGRHQMLDKGPVAYDDIYRIPLVVSGPDVAGGTCNDFVYLHDMFPTILETARAGRCSCDGDSLVPLLTGGEGWRPRDEVFGSFDTQVCTAPSRSVRTKQHKFVFSTSGIPELYDLERDPAELHNVVCDPAYRTTKRDLIARLAAHLERTEDLHVGRLLNAVKWAL